MVEETDSVTFGRRTMIQMSSGCFLFGLCSQKVAADTDQISYGDIVRGTTDGEWIFEANEDDEITIEMRPTNADNNARLSLLDPDGDSVTSDFQQSGEDGNAVITLYEVGRGEDGEYTIVTSGEAETDQFEYELFLYEGIPIDEHIEYGDSVERKITRSSRYYNRGNFNGYHETFSFEADRGDEISIEMRPTDSANDAQLALFDPDGNRATYDFQQSGEDGNAVITLYEVDRGEDGEYTIVASGGNETDRFEYELFLYEGIPIDEQIEYGESVEREITRSSRYYNRVNFNGYHETFSFEANSGDEVSIEMQPTESADNARLTLFNPDGNRATYDFQQSGEGGTAVLNYEVGRDEAGTYVIVATGDESEDTFAYNLDITAENIDQTDSEDSEEIDDSEDSEEIDDSEDSEEIDDSEDSEEIDDATPGFGIGSAITAVGSAGYLLNRRIMQKPDLNDNSEQKLNHNK